MTDNNERNAPMTETSATIEARREQMSKFEQEIARLEQIEGLILRPRAATSSGWRRSETDSRRTASSGSRSR